jgi:hypothetical protein
LINERTGEKEKYSWNDMREAWRKIILVTEKSAEASWSLLFGKKFPEVAPVQPPKKVEKVNPKPEQTPKKAEQEAPKAETFANANKAQENVNETSKNQTLNDFIPDIPKPEVPEEPDGQQSPEPCTENEPVEQEKQLPGQISIEDMPEVLPETEYDRKRKSYIAEVNECIDFAKRKVNEEKWGLAALELRDAIRALELLETGEDDGQE